MCINRLHVYFIRLDKELQFTLSLSLSHTHTTTHRKTELEQDIECIIIFKKKFQKARMHFITIDNAHIHIMQNKACFSLFRCLYSVFTRICSLVTQSSMRDSHKVLFAQYVIHSYISHASIFGLWSVMVLASDTYRSCFDLTRESNKNEVVNTHESNSDF